MNATGLSWAFDGRIACVQNVDGLTDGEVHSDVRRENYVADMVERAEEVIVDYDDPVSMMKKS